MQIHGAKARKRIDEPAVGGRGTHLLHGAEGPAEVVLAHQRDHAGLVRGHGGHSVAARGRAEHPCPASRPADQADRLADAVDERRHVLLQARRRVVRVVGRQSAAAGARQVAGEPVGEVGQQGLPGDLAVADPAVDQDQRRPLSLYSSGDLGAVGGDRSVDALVSVMVISPDRSLRRCSARLPGRSAAPRPPGIGAIDQPAAADYAVLRSRLTGLTVSPWSMA